jgi:dihydroorotate dehydrogenase
MLASSHGTSSGNALRQLAAVSPSAVTLKTTSPSRGADGTGGRDKVLLLDSYNHHFAGYTDGARTAELWDIATTYEMTRHAQQILPRAAIGLSVLQQEDYATIARQLSLDAYAYVELNWKYSFRGADVSNAAGVIRQIKDDLDHFIEAFRRKPVLVKLSRETIPYLMLDGFSEIFDAIEGANAGVIVANSKRIAVPPSRVDETKPRERSTGVVTGEWLFLETYDMIRSIRQTRPRLPIVATGGITDTSSVVDAIAVGADAVQLCTVLDIQTPQALSWLRQQLSQLAQNSTSYADWVSQLRADSAVRSQVVVSAREFRWDRQRYVDEIVNKPDLLIPSIVAAVTNELADIPPETTPADDAVIPPRLRFVITRGNVSTFLLAHKLVTSANLVAIPLNSAGEFLNAAARGAIEYDLAVIPESSLRIADNDGRLPGTSRQPIRVGVAARSRYELVGRAPRSINDLQFVYHFGGTSSRHALAALLTAVHPEPITISGGKLLPLLRFWPDDGAILAKPPLSRVYGMLARDDIKASWSPLWTTDEALVLVASREFVDRGGGMAVARALLRLLESERAAALATPERAAREILNAGFLSDVTALFSASK